MIKLLAKLLPMLNMVATLLDVIVVLYKVWKQVKARNLATT